MTKASPTISHANIDKKRNKKLLLEQMEGRAFRPQKKACEVVSVSKILNTKTK